jgi:hypothetical protein
MEREKAAMTIERDQVDAWCEAHPEAALAEAIGMSIGCVLQHEPNEAKRAGAINTLIEAHQKALAEFAWPKRARLN